jgi:hypothetical protein
MRRLGATCFCLLIFASGCSRVYYGAMEKIGKEKRDILVGRVLDARKDQEEARQQFANALEAFQALTGFSGGNLEKTYDKLNKEYERCTGRAQDVSDRIVSIEKVSRDLFKEWEGEIARMNDRDLQSRSRVLLADTRKRYEALHRRMKSAEKRMQPVLRSFEDKVLFLKHNLNAQAIRGLKNDAVRIDADVAGLLKELEAAIAEADAFIASMKAAETPS